MKRDHYRALVAVKGFSAPCIDSMLAAEQVVGAEWNTATEGRLLQVPVQDDNGSCCSVAVINRGQKCSEWACALCRFV